MTAAMDQIGSNALVCLKPRRKVKSGCQTCKRRKVKCDEGRPACHRCESTGRVCDGYGIWGGGSRAHVSSQDHPSHKTLEKSSLDSSTVAQTRLDWPIRLASLHADETAGFEWFMYRSAVKLPGVFVSDHWTALLCQASATEPAVRHAVITLSSAHREEVQGSGSLGRECDDAQTRFTLTQYSKTLKHLQPSASDVKRVSVNTIILSCALFVSADFLRGHYTNGLVHLRHGLNLLLETKARMQDQRSPSDYVDGWLITAFTRLLVQAKLLGQLRDFSGLFICGPHLQPTLNTFNSTHHARRTLEHLMLRALDIQERWSRSLVGAVDTSRSVLLNDQLKIQVELDIWSRARDASLARLPPAKFSRERFAYGLLKLYSHLAVVLASTCTDASNELRFDRCDQIFRKIISHCVETHKFVYPNGQRNPRGHHDPEPTSPNSITDIGWIAPLFFTIIKCRKRRVRHQALRLLRSSPHREGIWSTSLVVAIACKVVEIEECDWYDDQLTEKETFEMLEAPTDEDIAAAPILPVGFRVDEIEILLPEDRAGSLLLRCRRPTREHQVEWISQEYDLRTCEWTDASLNTDTEDDLATPTSANQLLSVVPITSSLCEDDSGLINEQSTYEGFEFLIS